MKGFLSFITLNFIPKSPDFGLLLLRAGLGIGILFLHGWNKWINFSKLAPGFPDPLHLQSTKVSLGLTVFAEVVCAALLIIGLCTRFAALALAITMGVAFFLQHKVALSGQGSGELAAVYLLGFVTLLVAGPGRFSFDSNGGSGAKPH